jgi:hypothetical protein
LGCETFSQKDLIMQTSASRSISYSLPWDDAPIDLSFVFADEKPAGRHGFLQVRNGKFVFEDGAPGRFWGTNFNSAANFPPHSHSEKVARRLAKFGINIVRFHQMDGEWSTPNIFQFTKGPRLETTRKLDPLSLDRLDYLVFCLKQEGIYVYMDLLTYRKFRSGDGVPAADQLPPSARPYTNFDQHLIELQKEFNTQLWTHVNPYTGLAYKDDPAVALSEIANENELFAQGFMHNMVEPYRTQLETRYVAWAQNKGLPPVKTPVDLSSGEPTLLSFLAEIQKAYYAEMTAHMRTLGVRIPITGTNWVAGGAPSLETHRDTDFTDSHTYWYDWTWRVTEKKLNNRSMLGERDAWLTSLTFFRLLDKPFFVSEWDDPWPNEWRAESSLYLAAVAGLQGWAGATIHTYRYDCRENVDMIAAPITSDALSGVPYRSGVFDTFNDPAKFGLFYHAALMIRRGDVRESSSATEVVLPALHHPVDPAHPDRTLIHAKDIEALQGAAEIGKVAMRLPDSKPGTPRQVPMNSAIVPVECRELRSDTGELYRNLNKRYGTIDTPRTKVAYGFLGAAGEIVLKGLKIKGLTDFGVIALSSLNHEDIGSSDNLLLTAVGRADNTGAEYNADHTLQLKLGHGPVLAEVIEAEIEIQTNVTGFKIWAVNPAGSLIGQVQEVLKDGVLRFTLGGPFPSIYYLIQKQ